MVLQYKRYPFTPNPGWSLSRYEMFDKCRRQYYYQYYAKHVPDVPSYKLQFLKGLTSVPLEIGNVVHDVLEAFLRRLQKSDAQIDERRFFEFARTKVDSYFRKKTFIETYYGQMREISIEAAIGRIEQTLQNFIDSPIYSWLFMKAIRNRENWMIEPEGYGETRLDGLKAYCKMDFLFPVDGHIHILDWKTGKKDERKHAAQLIGYATAASSNFDIPVETIFPRIVYLYPEFQELEIAIQPEDIESFFETVRSQLDEMRDCLKDPDNNIPHDIELFPMRPHEALCRHCRFQELCFPENRKGIAKVVEF
jgi:CRISPR/Cas system-associated exonuclease Cas4 (RecB family)